MHLLWTWKTTILKYDNLRDFRHNHIIDYYSFMCKSIYTPSWEWLWENNVCIKKGILAEKKFCMFDISNLLFKSLIKIIQYLEVKTNHWFEILWFLIILHVYVLLWLHVFGIQHRNYFQVFVVFIHVNKLLFHRVIDYTFVALSIRCWLTKRSLTLQ